MLNSEVPSIMRHKGLELEYKRLVSYLSLSGKTNMVMYWVDQKRKELLESHRNLLTTQSTPYTLHPINNIEEN